MHKYLSVMLMFLGSTWAQAVKERDCSEYRLVHGCPGWDKVTEADPKSNPLLHPVSNPPVPGVNSSNPRPLTAKPDPIADSDWKRPRLTKPLAADWPRWTFAQPDAGALVGMKLTALVQSPVLNALLGADVGKQWRDSIPLLDEAWVSIRSLSGQKTEAVMLLIGPAVESIATGLRSKGVTVCFLDKRTLLAGEWNAVNQALARVIAGAPSPVFKRAGELWSANDLWLIAGRQMVNQLLPAGANTPGLAGVSLGLNLQKGVAIDMLLMGTTPAETARWASKLSQDPGDLGLGDVRVEKTAGGVRIRAALDVAQLPDALRQQITDQIRPVLDIAGPPPTRATTSGGAVVIQGLDGGPRTVPMEKQKQ
jgi:hypothetical protein